MPPIVGFTISGLDARRRQVAWTARARAEGREGVYFFDAGELRTAHGLARASMKTVLVRAIEKARRTAKRAAARPR